MDKKQCRKYIVPVILTALVCLFLFTRPEICSEGVRSGILLAAETVVPSLFPFMTVASFLLRSGLGEAAGKPFDKVCEKLSGRIGSGYYYVADRRISHRRKNDI